MKDSAFSILGTYPSEQTQLFVVSSNFELAGQPVQAVKSVQVPHYDKQVVG